MSGEQADARGGSSIGDSVMLVLAAIVAVFAIVLWRGRARESTPQPERMSATAWRDLASGGTPLSASEGAVRVVIFSDFQCPYCALLSKTVSEIDSIVAGRAAIRFRHFPLESHEFALDAAIAAQCAATQGRFRAFHDLLFREQDSIGVKTFEAFAAQVGVVDSAKFTACRSDERVLAQVREEIAAGERIPVTGTPTLVIEGAILRGALDPLSLMEAIQRAAEER